MEEMSDYDKFVVDLLSVCINLLDSPTLPDGLLRDVLEELAGQLTLESARTMTAGIYEDA